MAVIVTLPYDPTWTALEWAKENCPSYITNANHFSAVTGWYDSNKIDYFFGNDAEATAFMLRWI